MLLALPKGKTASAFELYNASHKLNQLANEAMKKREDWSASTEIINTERNLDEFSVRSAFSFLEPTPYLQVNDSSLSQKLDFS